MSFNTKSDKFMQNREAVPVVSPQMYKAVSQYRRSELDEDITNGKMRESGSGGNSNYFTNTMVRTSASNVVAGGGIKKSAQLFSGSGTSSGTGYHGSGGTVRQGPEMYSPLWLNSNLNLPRDRATINAWCRSFFALNPVVQNAVSLHSTYPIAKLNIKCEDPKVQQFFETMSEELDLMNICVQIAQEYWTLGESFIYADLDESAGKWSRLLIQNPDYMVVKRSVIANEPIISLRPDENLRRICTSNKPSDIQQRQQLEKNIIEHVRRGENIPFSNFFVSHLARRISPYEIRGTSLLVGCFRALMLLDKLRECYSTDTEVLTDQGFKNIADLLEFTDNLNVKKEFIKGLIADDFGNLLILTLKDNFKVACVNPDTNEIEYHKPTEFYLSQYDGKMLNFIGKKIDCLVTPNHKVWVKEKTKRSWTKFEKREAKTLLNKKTYYKFSSLAKFVTDKTIDYVNVIGHDVPIELYLKILGYIVSEGCIYQSNDEERIYQNKNKRYDASVSLSQLTESDACEDMRNSFNEFANIINKHVNSSIKIRGAGYSKHCPKEKWTASISGKDIVEHFRNEIGTNGKVKSKYKRLPRWVLDLKPELLNILLEALVKGDGSERKNKTSTGYSYSTISKELADNVFELAYKVGYVPRSFSDISKKSDGRIVEEHVVGWSTTNYGVEPLIYTAGGRKKNCGGGASIKEIDYNGKVWCFEVPTGLFITRRNGVITIQGNCDFTIADEMITPFTIVKIGGGADNYKPTPADLEFYREAFEQAHSDRNFKLFTHDGVNVERIGYGQGIYDTTSKVQQLMKELYIGLMVPNVIMDGGGDVTYANGGVTLDVLRQRYFQFRNMLSAWLRRKIFAPISKINDFYNYKNKQKVLIVPDIEWNHMSLFDMSDYIQTLTTLSTGQQKFVSSKTLYRSLGLEYDDEIRKIRKEMIDTVIQQKEMESLAQMPLNELRALDDNKEIQEVQRSPLPGENPYESKPEGGVPSGGGGGLPGEIGGGLTGMPGGLGGGPPTAPPAFPSEPPK